MNNKKIMIIIGILLVIISVYSIYLIISKDSKTGEKQENNIYISELIEDECTEDYIRKSFCKCNINFKKILYKM